ncbi:MAG: TonB-dependent receptor [Sphingomicrobium sp.]
MTGRRFTAARALRGGASTLALGAIIFAPAAYAQTTTTEAAEETTPISAQTDPDAASTPEDPSAIVITGQRRALRNAQQIKRNADTVVDSITATDIGSFPDKSIAEALQRVPGITVNRFAATGDTAHFSAEPSGVIVRGLPQVRSEFNGRDTFSANSSRGLSWSDITPELMAGVDTYKNQTAELIEGGIAGSINMRTRVPFDATGQLFQVGANMNYNDLAKKWSPDANVFYSNRWDTGMGEIGIMGNAAYSKVNTASQGIQYGRAGVFDNVFPESGSTTVYAPSGVSFRDNLYERTRTGIAAAVQWKSLDDRLLFTTQYNRSVYKSGWDERVVSANFFGLFGQNATYRFNPSNDPLSSGVRQNPRRAPGSDPFTFDDDGWLTGGTFSQYNGWFGPPGQQPGFGVNSSGQGMFQACYTWGCPSGGQPGTYGAGANTASRSNDNRNMTQDISANLKFEATDRLRFNFDVQRVNSTIDNYDIEVDFNSFANVRAEFIGRPTVEFLPPTHVVQSPGALANPNNYYINAVMDHLEDSKGRQYAGRADAEYDLNTDWMDSIKFGARMADRKQKVQWSTYNWHNVANTWTDYSPCPHPFFNVDSTPRTCVRAGQPTVNFLGYPSGSFEVAPFGTDYHGGNLGDFTFVPRDFLRDGRASEYSQTLTGVGGFEPICNRNGQRTQGGDTIAVELPDSCFTPDEISDVTEKTKAVYAMLRFGGPNASIGGVGVTGNIGVRYVNTTNESRGFTRWPTRTGNANSCPATPLVPGGLTGTGVPPAIPPGAPAPFALFPSFCYQSPADLAFTTGGGVESTVKVKHHHLLPSFNVRFDLSPKWLLRFAASKAMSRPDIGQLKNFVAISQGLPANVSTDPRWIINAAGQPTGITPTYTATAFNPYLKPITAWQFDLSLENYFANVGSFSFAVFHKRFKDYIQTGLFNVDYTNGGTTRTVQVSGPANGKGAKISGFEAAYTRYFDFLPEPLNGLGIQTNLTYLKNKGVPNSGLSSVGSPLANGGGFTNGTVLNPGSLEGLSKWSYNLVGMYEKGPIAARLAYNWRSRYLVTAVDCCVALPVWQDGSGYLDGSVRYTVNKAVELSFQVSNILNTQTILLQQVEDETTLAGKRVLVPNAFFQQDRRFTMGARLKFGQ